MKKPIRTRRDFLKITAATGAAFTVPLFNIISKPVLYDEIIGHGSYRYKVHIPWLLC